MQSLWLAGLFFASPGPVTLWLRADLPSESPCRVESLAAAIRAQRPDARLVVGERPSSSDLEATLTETAGTLSLIVQGRGRPLSRVLPTPQHDCVESLQTAALMIDRYLDELNEDADETAIEGLTSSRRTTAFLISLGPSLTQAPAGWTPGLVLEADLGVGWLLFSLGGEINLAQHKAATAVTGTYDIQPAAVWVAAGVAPHLGPGRLLGQVSGGANLTFVTIGPTTPATYQQQQGSAADGYLGLRAGYVLDLPAKFNLALRYEERWVPSPTTFSVYGYPGSVSVRAFAGDLALLVGYTLF